MVCKMVKKGVIGAALTAGALYLAFGTHAPSYVRTAFHKVRHTAKDSVPIQFDIERARVPARRGRWWIGWMGRLRCWSISSTATAAS